MDQQADDNSDLDKVRRRLDGIDDAILSLLQQRFEIVADVRRAKQATSGNTTIFPLRPAREALVVRRLLAQNDGRLPDAFVFKLWRTIMCEASLAQGPIAINTTCELLDDRVRREAIENYFVGFPVEGHQTVSKVLKATANDKSRLAIVAADSSWLSVLDENEIALDVISTLTTDGAPLLVLGDAGAQPTGGDETLMASNGRLPRDFVPSGVWEVETEDGFCLTSVPGFLSMTDQVLIGLTRQNANLALRVLGRYPSPFDF